MKIKVVQKDGLVREVLFTEDGLVREMYKREGETFAYTKFSSYGIETKTAAPNNMLDGPKKYLLAGASEKSVSASYPMHEVEFEIWDKIGVDFMTNKPIYMERNTREIATYRNKTEQKRRRDSTRILRQSAEPIASKI